MGLPLVEIADKLDLNIIGDLHRDIIVSGIGSLKESKESQISFIANSKYVKYLADTKACAVIMNYDSLKGVLPERPNFLILDTKNPYLAFAKATRLFYYNDENDGIGINEDKNYPAPAYYIDKTALIGENSLLYPGVFIGAGVVIGRNCKILSNTYIGKNVRIGDNVLIYPNVSVYDNCIIGNGCIIHAGSVVGSDGFGYARDKTGYIKIMHLGYAVLEDDVELGANVTVDRGVVDFTKIGKGTKIDNLVQIAHNVVIGRNCVIAAQTGIAGSATIGDNATIGGQVGIAGHISIGNNVMIAAQSGVHGNVADNEIISGTPAFDIKEWRNAVIRFKKLPDLFKRVRFIEKELWKDGDKQDSNLKDSNEKS